MILPTISSGRDTNPGGASAPPMTSSNPVHAPPPNTIMLEVRASTYEVVEMQTFQPQHHILSALWPFPPKSSFVHELRKRIAPHTVRVPRTCYGSYMRASRVLDSHNARTGAHNSDISSRRRKEARPKVCVGCQDDQRRWSVLLHLV